MKLGNATLRAFLLASAAPALAQVEHDIPMRPYSLDESHLIASSGGTLARTAAAGRSPRPEALRGRWNNISDDYTIFADLSKRLDRELAALDQLLAADLPAPNQKLAAVHLPAVRRRPEPPVEPGTATMPGSWSEDGDDDE